VSDFDTIYTGIDMENPNKTQSSETLAPPPIMAFFKFEHLPTKLQDVSRPFCELAEQMMSTLPRSAETSAGLRKLLEAKDCAVRASL
jgi:hypothetical protein